MVETFLLDRFAVQTPWRPTWRRYFMQGLFVFLFAFLTTMSVIPATDDGVGNMISQWLARFFMGASEHSDKVTHFLAYGILTGTAMWGRLAINGRPVILLIALIIWSGLLEIAQYFTGYRFLDVMDLLANSLGAVSGFVTALFIQKHYDRHLYEKNRV